MNMNHHTRPPRPGPDCAFFADLLALVGQERLNANDTSDLRRHLETCSYCQHELNAYNRLDGILRQHFGPLERGPLSRREIAQMMNDGADAPPNMPPARSTSTALREPSHRSRASVAIGNTRPPRRTRPTRRLISAISAIAAVLVIALISAALFASRSHVSNGIPKKPTPTIAPTATLPAYAPTNGDLLNSIAMVSPNEGWIAGSTPIGQGNFEMLLLHSIDGRFLKVPPASVQGLTSPPASLQQVVMLSANEGWATGIIAGSSCSSTVILHYTGGHWKQDTTLAGGFPSISMISPTDGWLAGGTCSGVYEMLHYDGTNWTPVQAPSLAIGLQKVVMVSASNGWAIGWKNGTTEMPPGLLLHYDGKSWAEVSIPAVAQLGLVQFADVAMISATDGWLAGTVYQGAAVEKNALYAGTPSRSVLFHYDGKQWSKANTPLDAIRQGAVTSLSLASSGDGWLVGASLDTGAFFLHLTGGMWTNVAPPTDASTSQVFTLSADDAWAIGMGDQGDPFLLHYHSSTWVNVSLTTAPAPTATSTSTASAPACSSHTPPAGVSGTPGATVTPAPSASWSSYTNTAYHYTLKYPGNWGADNITCPDSGSVTFWNYDYSNWNQPGFPKGAVKIELDTRDNSSHQSALAFWQAEQQNDQQGVGGPPCPAFTTQSLKVAGRDSVEGGCPAQNYVVFYIPDGDTMLSIAQSGPPNEAASPVLQQIINTLAFTT
jgi:hypothetical protein